MQDMHSTVANHLVLTNFYEFEALCDAGGLRHTHTSISSEQLREETHSFYFTVIIY